MSSKSINRAKYEKATPSFLAPDHFECDQNTRVVAVYNEPIGDESENIVLLFPGDLAGRSPQQINTTRVGCQTIVFNTPVYSASRGQVEVTPILESSRGHRIEMGKFKLTLKHPLTTAMELCVKLSSSSAVLPVLTTLMLNASNDNRMHFKDPHTDRMMTLLVGSMKPGTSDSIKDILLPDKGWGKKNLADLAREFGLRNMEKEAYMLVNPQKRSNVKRRETITHGGDEGIPSVGSSLLLKIDDEDEETRISSSFSSPTINKIGLKDEEQHPWESDRVLINNQFQNQPQRVYFVTKDFNADEPGMISLKVGQQVYLLTGSTSVSGMWQGTCEGRQGLFPASCVEPATQYQANNNKSARILPLPSLPQRDQILTMPASKELQSPIHTASRKKLVSSASVPAKAYRKTHISAQAPTTSSNNDSCVSCDYVDMVTAGHAEQNSSGSEGRENLNIAGAEEQVQGYWRQRPEESLLFSQNSTKSHTHGGNVIVTSPPGRKQKQPLPLPYENKQIKHSPKRRLSGQQDTALPIPPTRTSSRRQTFSQSEGSISEGDVFSESDDDKLDYVNIDEMGFPLIKGEEERRKKYQFVKGNMYELLDLEDPDTLPAQAKNHNPTEARIQEHRARLHRSWNTHEKVELKPSHDRKVPINLPVKPVVRGDSTSQGRSVLARVHWLQQELQGTQSPSTHWEQQDYR